MSAWLYEEGIAFMLKKYPIDQLREGMVIGRAVHKEDMSILLEEGTILDRSRIDLLEQRDVLFVHILEPDEEKEQEPETPRKKGAGAGRQAALEDPLGSAAETGSVSDAEMDGAAAASSDAPRALGGEDDIAAEERPTAPESRGEEPAAPSGPDGQTLDEAAAGAAEDSAAAEEAAAESAADEAAAGTERKAASETASAGAAPDKRSPLEAAYVRQYDALFLELKKFYGATRETNRIDVPMAETIALKALLLCSSAKAITHIYNMEAVGDYQLHHTMRVAVLAGLMGHWLKMPRKKQQRLVLAALLMDIGYTRMATDFLKKIAHYTPEERRFMQKHVRLGYALVAAADFEGARQVADAVLQHHERNDGSGYPARTKKEKICEFARILAILDMYDAMASRRFYAKKRSPFEVFGILSDEIVAGHLDTEYGVAFIRRICHALNGNWVKLSNGEKGKIVYIDESRLTALPIVQTTSGEFLDLNRRSDIKVESLLRSYEIETA